jgi:hypothetical protein
MLTSISLANPYLSCSFYGNSSASSTPALEIIDAILVRIIFQNIPAIDRLSYKIRFRQTARMGSTFSAITIWLANNECHRIICFIPAFTSTSKAPVTMPIPGSFGNNRKPAILLPDFNGGFHFRGLLSIKSSFYP